MQMKGILLLFVLTALSCDGSAPPPPHPVPQAQATPPPPPPDGVLRVRPRPGLPEGLASESLSAGIPALHVGLEYTGPRSCLEIQTGCWVQGKSLGDAGKHLYEVRLPLSGALGIGFGEERTPGGLPVVTVLQTTLLPASPGKATWQKEVQKFGADPLKGHRISSWEPAWPYDIQSDYGAVFWGVFVDEPVGQAPAESPEARAVRAGAAWIFWLRMTEKDYSPAEPFDAGTTTFPRVGGRRVARFHCTVDLATGKAEVDHRDPVDQAGWDNLQEHVSQSGHTWKVVIEDNHRTRKIPAGELGIPGFPDRARVRIVEIDDASHEVVRNIPVQEFRGEHEKHGPRALRLKDQTLSFWMDFWTLD